MLLSQRFAAPVGVFLFILVLPYGTRRLPAFFDAMLYTAFLLPCRRRINGWTVFFCREFPPWGWGRLVLLRTLLKRCCAFVLCTLKCRKLALELQPDTTLALFADQWLMGSALTLRLDLISRWWFVPMQPPAAGGSQVGCVNQTATSGMEAVLTCFEVASGSDWQFDGLHQGLMTVHHDACLHLCYSCLRWIGKVYSAHHTCTVDLFHSILLHNNT